ERQAHCPGRSLATSVCSALLNIAAGLCLPPAILRYIVFAQTARSPSSTQGQTSASP
ncbi:hypothetical protein BDQ12DRAFT_737631, partial [Crucibulum laeve]